MKATEVTLHGFLSQNRAQFVIPVYQRNYDWTQEQCSQLFKDILDVGAKSGQTHFIGSIVFIHDGVYTSSEVKQLVVIDGQQRLTTFTLIYLALHKFALKNNSPTKAAEIYETYLVNKYVSEEESKLKLKQSDANSKAFKFIFGDNNPANYPDYSRLIENYEYFRRNITAHNFEAIENGLNRLLFVEISLERGKDDPQRIFESLNSTGLELSQADLIRNYILMGLEPAEQVRIFNNYWEIIESNARDYEREENRVSDFIRDYLTFKNKKIPNKSRVYEEFKHRYASREDRFYRETLQEIKDLSFHYNKLLNPAQEPDLEIRKQLNYIQRLEINISYPFLLPLYNDYNEGILDKHEFVSVLRLIQSFVWRRFILGLPTNALNKIFMTLYTDVDKNNYENSLQRALVKKRGSQRFPTDAEVEVTLAEKDVYNIQSKNRIYFLELLENHNNREYVSVDNPDITIEHIFPQTPDEKWFDHLDPDSAGMLGEKYLHSIANLTLSGNNGSLGNRTFREKKTMNVDGKEQGYLFSRLWLNQFLKEIDEWNVENMKARYSLLVKRFQAIWPYPAVDFEDEFDADEEYTIYNAPDPRFRKLDYFIFKDEKLNTTEISKMYNHVLKTLCHDNPSAFYHPEMKALLGLSANPEELRSPSQLGPALFYESNIDNNGKFRRLKGLLTKLDCEEDLLINFSNDEPGGELEGIVDKEQWIRRLSPDMLEVLDKCERLLKEIDPNVELAFKERYIGISRHSRAQNFVILMPGSAAIRAGIKVHDAAKWTEFLKINGLKFLSHSPKSARLRFYISEDTVREQSNALKEIFLNAHRTWFE